MYKIMERWEKSGLVSPQNINLNALDSIYNRRKISNFILYFKSVLTDG